MSSTEPAPPADAAPLVPVIPNCTQFKYYRTPPFLRSNRPKRKVAIVFGYIGEKYCGLQWNKLPAHPTVEEALLKALFETDMVSLVNIASLKLQQTLDFERASRTDKGVHALRNVVSVNVMLPYNPAYAEKKAQEAAAVAAANEAQTSESNNTNSNEKAEEEEEEDKYSYTEAARLLNLALPADIHVYDVMPVTRSYNAYMCCGWRRYEYYLPTYCLMNKSDYCERYFPASLAPAKPTLLEVGMQPGVGGGRKHGRRGPAVQDEGGEGTNTSNNTESAQGERKKDSDSGYGRKSKGHFPTRKAKKHRLEAEAAAAAAAADSQKESEEVTKAEEQADAEEEEAQEEEDAETEQQKTEWPEQEKLPLDQAHATHFHDGIFEHMILFRSIPEEAMRAVAANYRLSDAQLQRVRAFFQQYEGTRLYHNFTPGGKSNDPSCHRFIRKVTVSEPFVVYPDADDEDEDEDAKAEAHTTSEKKVGEDGATRVSSALMKESVEFWSPSLFFSPDEKIVEEYTAMWKGSTESGGGEAEEAPKTEEERAAEEQEKAAAMRESILQHMQRVYGHSTVQSSEEKNGVAAQAGRRGGLEVVRIEMEGQSFLLNQIRKMVGAVICCCATDSSPTRIQAELLHKHTRRGIPMAPANGLFLSYLDFTKYNARLERIQSHGRNGGNKQSLELSEVNQQELADWRAKTVAVVLRNEMAEDVCGKWMRSLRCVLRLAWVTELP